MRTRYMPLVLIFLVAAACGSAEEPPTATEPGTTASTVTAEPTPTTTMVPAPTEPPASPEVWAVTYRRDFPGYVIELIELASDRRIVIPTNRFDPYPGVVFGDGAGGLVIGASLTHLPALAQYGSLFSDVAGFPDTVVPVDGVATALIRKVDAETEWHDNLMHRRGSIELVAQPLGAEPRSVLTADFESTIDYFTGEGEQVGDTLSKVAYGGGVLALLWTRRYDCGRLELRAGFADAQAAAVNPYATEQCGEAYGGLLDIALTADGRHLITLSNPPSLPAPGGPDLVLWSLEDGRELDRLPAVLTMVHDGDRRLIVDRRIDDSQIERAVVEVPDGAFVVTPRPDLDFVVGVISGPLDIAAGATLLPHEPWVTCSTAGRDVTLGTDGSLPEAVVATRSAIIDAVLDCDLFRLADLAATSHEFRSVDADVACDEPWEMSLQDDDVVSGWYHADAEFGELWVMLEALAEVPTRSGNRYVFTGEHGYRIEIGASGAWLLNWRTFPRPPCETIDCTC